MQNRIPPQLDMTPDGSFRAPPGPALTTKIGVVAVAVAVLAGALSVAAFVFWFALSLIPVVLVAGAVAWLAFRVQVWRMRRSVRFARGVYRR